MTIDLLSAVDHAATLCRPAMAMETNWRLDEAIALTRKAVDAHAAVTDIDAISDEEHDDLDRTSEAAWSAFTFSAGKLTTATAWRDRMTKSEWSAVQDASRGVRILRLAWTAAIGQMGAELKLASALRGE